MDSRASSTALDLTIAEATRRLRDWLSALVPDVPVSLTLPHTDDPDDAITLYLSQITPETPQRTTRPPLLLLRLRYLLWVTLRDVEQAHHWLDRILFRAMNETDMEVSDAGLTAADWQAYGLAPRPCIAISLRIQRVQVTPQPIVTQPPVMDLRGLVTVAGQVLGPGGAPLNNATVEVLNSDQRATTDRLGQFWLRLISSDGRPGSPAAAYTLICRARGRQQTQTITTDAPQPIRFHFNALHTLTGRVVDGDDRPVPGVAVSIEAQDLHTETDPDGVFYFPAVDSLQVAEVTARHQRKRRSARFNPVKDNGKSLLIRL